MLSTNQAPPSEQATAPSSVSLNSNIITSVRKTNPPSCNLCRQRKVKCDRTDPCSNCVRVGEVCVSSAPLGAPRGRQGGRRKHERKLLDRVAKLESLVNGIESGITGSKPVGPATSDGDWTVCSLASPTGRSWHPTKMIPIRCRRYQGLESPRCNH